MRNALNSKVVVITGASSGIGEAMAKLYAQMGAKVVLGARSEEKLKELTERLLLQVVRLHIQLRMLLWQRIVND